MEDSLAVVLPKTGNHKKRLNNGSDLGVGGLSERRYIIHRGGGLKCQINLFFLSSWTGE